MSLPDRDKDISGTHWRESGDMCTHAPAPARAAGAVVPAVIGMHGELRVRRLSPFRAAP